MKVIIDIEPELFNNVVKRTQEGRCMSDVWLAVGHGTPYEERPQGEWVRTGQSFVNPNKFRNFCCSNCFWELDEHIRIEPNFCPKCGAKMITRSDL